MSTTIASDKSVRGRPRWRALGIDNKGAWHNVRVRAGEPDEVVVVDRSGILHRRYADVSDWVEAISNEAGWQDHPAAAPGRGWLEVATR